jgi:hypothetical protein
MVLTRYPARYLHGIRSYRASERLPAILSNKGNRNIRSVRRKGHAAKKTSLLNRGTFERETCL